jgi:hypothetical protein
MLTYWQQHKQQPCSINKSSNCMLTTTTTVAGVNLPPAMQTSIRNSHVKVPRFGKKGCANNVMMCSRLWKCKVKRCQTCAHLNGLRKHVNI